MTKIPYAICRTNKLHRQDLAKASQHNFREVQVLNADEKSSIVPLWGTATGATFLESVSERYEAWKTRKLAAHTGKRGAKMARDPVVCVEVLLTASPEYFRPLEPDRAGYWQADRLNAWKQTVERFAKAHFGDNLVSLVLHLDEATPHAHCLCMPFDAAGNLNAKRVFNRAELIRLQDAYADACKPLGLQRGLRGSKAKHSDIKDFYGLVNRVTPTVSLKKVQRKVSELPGKLERMSDEKLNAFADEVFRSGVKSAAIVYDKKLQVLAAKADAFDLAQRREDDASHALAEARKLASEVRVIPLDEVLARLGATPDARTSNRWLLPGRTLTVQGSKFYDADAGKGGGGAIDLVKHCEGIDYPTAVAWLSQEFGKAQAVGEAVRASHEVATQASQRPQPLPVPSPVPGKLSRVRDYLTRERHISTGLVEGLIDSGNLYGDAFGNCVFKSVTSAGEVGAELRGTQGVVFHGNRGKMSAFVLTPANRGSREVIFVKSAVDALSYRTLHPDCGWIYSVAGQVVKQVRELARKLVAKGFTLVAAFGKQGDGMLMTHALEQVGAKQRVMPPSGGDWNDELIAHTRPAETTEPKPSRKLSLTL